MIPRFQIKWKLKGTSIKHNSFNAIIPIKPWERQSEEIHLPSAHVLVCWVRGNSMLLGDLASVMWENGYVWLFTVQYFRSVLLSLLGYSFGGCFSFFGWVSLLLQVLFGRSSPQPSAPMSCVIVSCQAFSRLFSSSSIQLRDNVHWRIVKGNWLWHK